LDLRSFVRARVCVYEMNVCDWLDRRTAVGSVRSPAIAAARARGNDATSRQQR